MITVRLIQSGDENDVRAYLQAQPHAIIYHTLEWQKVIEKSYRYPSKLVLCLADNRLAGLLPLSQLRNFKGQKKIVGFPFSHFVEPLYDSPEILGALISYAQKNAIRQQAGYLEIKSQFGSYQNWTQRSDYMISELDLKQELVVIKKGLKSSIKRNIRKAKANNIVIRIGNHGDSIDRFYELMVETRQRQGSLPYSRRFFHNLFQYLAPDQCKLFMAYAGARAIAGLIMLCHGKRAIYAYGASTSDRSLLQLRPNDLLFWRSIENMHKEHFDVYDFGVTPIGHSSLLRFKSQWGAENRKIIYSYFLCKSKMVPHLNRQGATVSIASRVFRNLPKPVLKVVGPILLRSLG